MYKIPATLTHVWGSVCFSWLNFWSNKFVKHSHRSRTGRCNTYKAVFCSHKACVKRNEVYFLFLRFRVLRKFMGWEQMLKQHGTILTSDVTSTSYPWNIPFSFIRSLFRDYNMLLCKQSFCFNSASFRSPEFYYCKCYEDLMIYLQGCSYKLM
jgi:hypothetical protein